MNVNGDSQMEHINSIETSERRHPNWYRVLLALLLGFAALQWTVGPVLGWIRPDATMGERLLVLKGITFVWFAVVIMRSTGWAAVGFRRPVRPASALYGIPLLLLGAMTLAGGVAPTMTVATFLGISVWLTLGVLIEEILFRGVMWEAVSGRGHFFAAISTSVGFGMLHLFGIGGEVPTSVVAAQMCFAVGTGILLAAVRIAAGTIWTAIAVHWVFNGLSFVASGGVAETLRPGMEVRMVGAGVVLGLVGLAAVALASRRARSRGEGNSPVGAESSVNGAGNTPAARDPDPEPFDTTKAVNVPLAEA
jgi:membrane protease YdiL (CAAX protease family)